MPRSKLSPLARLRALPRWPLGPACCYCRRPLGLVCLDCDCPLAESFLIQRQVQVYERAGWWLKPK